jgi:hypothetical protein
MKHNGLAVAGIIALAFAFTSCSKEPLRNLTEEESRIYITNFDSSANFGAFKTFSISDSVAVISNNQLEGKDQTPVDIAFITAVKNEMQKRGYIQVSRDQNPDLGVNVSRIYNSYTGVVNYGGGYWGGYYDYYDPFYWGYPGYSYYFPSYYGVYEVSEGALSVDALDLKDASGSKTIKGVWSGLIRGSGIFNPGTAASQVQALYDQSPYFKSNQ